MVNLTEKKRLAAPLLLIIVTGIIAYFSSFGGRFLWDDATLVQDNLYIRNFTNMLNIFVKNTGAGAFQEFSFYRPLQLFTYMLDYSIWGLNVFGYHLANTLLHIMVAIVLYYLVVLLFDNKMLSLFAAILFVVHPVHTETVCYISDRADLLSALFILTTLFIYINSVYRENKGFPFLLLLSCLLAFLSKENALIIIPLVLLYHYVFRQRLKISLFLPLLAAMFFYAALRISNTEVLHYSYPILMKRIPGFFVAITNYLRILIFPVDLHMDYGNVMVNIFQPKALFGLAITILLLAYAFITKKTNRLISFSIFWFFLALLPVTSIYPVNAFYMAEHWLYLSSIGFFLIAARMLCVLYRRITRMKYVPIFLTTLIVIISLYLTIKQNSYWNDPILFYKRTLRYSPYSAFAYHNLGGEYLKIGQKERAIEHYLKALAVSPGMAIAHYNLAEVYLADSDKKSALNHYRMAIEIDSRCAQAYEGLCRLAMLENKHTEAVDFCRKTIQCNPAAASAYYYLGNTYYSMGKKQESIDAYKKAVAVDQTYLEAYNNLAATYSELNQLDEAIKIWKRIIRVDPNFAVAHFNLAVFYFQKKQYALAIEYCDRVIALGHEVDPAFLEQFNPYRKKNAK